MQSTLNELFDKVNITGHGVCNLYYTPAVDLEYSAIPEHIQIYAHTLDGDLQYCSWDVACHDNEFSDVLSIMTHFGKHEKANIPTITELHIRRQDDGSYDCWSLGEDNAPSEKLETFKA